MADVMARYCMMYQPLLMKGERAMGEDCCIGTTCITGEC